MWQGGYEFNAAAAIKEFCSLHPFLSKHWYLADWSKLSNFEDTRLAQKDSKNYVKFEPIFCHYVQRMYLLHYVFNPNIDTLLNWSKLSNFEDAKVAQKDSKNNDSPGDKFSRTIVFCGLHLQSMYTIMLSTLTSAGRYV